MSVNHFGFAHSLLKTKQNVLKEKKKNWSAGGRSPERRSEHPYCQGSCELQQRSAITRLSHRGAMGAGTEQNHTQVTAAVTRARCAEGT